MATFQRLPVIHYPGGYRERFDCVERYDRFLHHKKINISNLLSKLADASAVADRKDVWEGVKLPTRHRCIKYICEQFGVCEDIAELLEKAYHKRLTNHGLLVLGQFESERDDYADHGSLSRRAMNPMRTVPRRLKNIRRGVPQLSGCFCMCPIANRHDTRWKVIDGILCSVNSFGNGYRLFCEPKTTTVWTGVRHYGTELKGCGKPEIIKALQERKIKHNKAKTKGTLAMLLWSK